MIPRKAAFMGLAALSMVLADLDFGLAPAPFFTVAIGTPSEARIGHPGTPLSYAGVARRTARRTARRVTRRTAYRVNALPAGCVYGPYYGSYYYNCGGAYYVRQGGVYVQVVVH